MNCDSEPKEIVILSAAKNSRILLAAQRSTPLAKALLHGQ
jgi:hypothetical protein